MLSPTSRSKNPVTLPSVFSSAARSPDRSGTGTIESDFVPGRAWLSDLIIPNVISQLLGPGGRDFVTPLAKPVPCVGTSVSRLPTYVVDRDLLARLYRRGLSQRSRLAPFGVMKTSSRTR